MLVLSRKDGQKIRIEGQGVSGVIEVKRHGNRIVVGLDFPDDVKIVREELKTDKKLSVS